MDKQKQKVLDLIQALSILDSVCAAVIKTDGEICWDRDPRDINMDLMAVARPSMLFEGKYVITYNNASRIIDKARSHKLTKRGDRGIDIIKTEWKKNYIGEI